MELKSKHHVNYNIRKLIDHAQLHVKTVSTTRNKIFINHRLP